MRSWVLKSSGWLSIAIQFSTSFQTTGWLPLIFVSNMSTVSLEASSRVPLAKTPFKREFIRLQPDCCEFVFDFLIAISLKFADLESFSALQK